MFILKGKIMDIAIVIEIMKVILKIVENYRPNYK